MNYIQAGFIRCRSFAPDSYRETVLLVIVI